MANRPVGRERRVVSGEGSGLKRSGEGLGKKSSVRGAEGSGKSSENVVKGILGLFSKKKR